MPDVLRDKVVLVTGASRGIGRAIAQRLAAEGAVVALTARGSLDGTVAAIEAIGGRAVALPADLMDDRALHALPDRVRHVAGGLDILVNNGGSATYGSIATMPVEAIDRMLGLYLRAPMLLAQAALPLMRARGRAWIVNIGSITALPPARPYTPASLGGADIPYAAAKAGLVRLTQGLAAALLEEDIAVNMASPSTAIRTPGADALIPADYPTERVEYLAETVLALCHRPARERTGLTAFSLHYPWATGLPVMSLDGATELPRIEPPSWRHPATPLFGDELTTILEGAA
jgi:3-oxoacyl-[acyl-carrier protein] reductase